MARNEVRKSAAQVSLGDVSVNVTAPSAGTLTVVHGSTTGTFNIPAGAYHILVYQAGFFQDGDQNKNGIIDGVSWPIQLPYELHAVEDPNTGVFKKLPALPIDGDGGRIFYKYTI